MNDGPMKPRILELLHFADQEEQQLMGTLSEAERSATGTGDPLVGERHPDQYSAVEGAGLSGR